MLEEKLNREANSGASIRIEEGAEGLVLVKTMPANDRSYANIKKQLDFYPTGNVLAANILGLEQKGTNIELMMPLLRGMVGADFSKDFGRVEATTFKKSLSDYIQHIRASSSICKFDRSVVDDKLNQLRSNPSFEKSQIKLLSHLSHKLAYIDCYPKGPCHGDLTLSNIIFQPKSKKVFLIDFLDVFIDSYLMDLIKLEQDLIYGWSSRFLTARDQLNGNILSSYLLDVCKFDDRNKWHDVYVILSVLNTLRIVPYCRDRVTYNWIKSTLASQEILL